MIFGSPLAAAPFGGQSLADNHARVIAVAVVTDLPIVEVILQHAPDINLVVAVVTDLPTVTLSLNHSIGLTVAVTTDLPTVSMSLYHDWSEVVADRPDFFAVYRAYLAKTGETTVELPMSSWQASLNYGERNSYVSAVIPSVATFGEVIAARAGGTLTIKKGYRNAISGDEQLEELFSIAVSSIRLDEGSQNSSSTLEGLATLTWPAAKTVAARGVTYRRVDADGALNLRGSVDLRVRPGDTVTYDGESFTVGRLSIQVSPRGESMEMTEA